jgi:hypothetical protein
MRFKVLVVFGSICILQFATNAVSAQAQPVYPFPSDNFGCPHSFPDQVPRGAKSDPLSTNASGVLDAGVVKIAFRYSAPSMRGRQIFGSLVPYDAVWRTGDNAATLFQTAMDIQIGNLKVPAGTYTLYSLPSSIGWKLIVNKQTCQWGTEYDERHDLGRVNMATAPVPPDPVETFTIRLEQHVHGPVRADDSYLLRTFDLHLIWENTDVYVSIAPIESADVGPASPQ